MVDCLLSFPYHLLTVHGISINFWTAHEWMLFVEVVYSAIVARLSCCVISCWVDVLMGSWTFYCWVTCRSAMGRVWILVFSFVKNCCLMVFGLSSRLTVTNCFEFIYWWRTIGFLRILLHGGQSWPFFDNSRLGTLGSDFIWRWDPAACRGTDSLQKTSDWMHGSKHGCLVRGGSEEVRK